MSFSHAILFSLVRSTLIAVIGVLVAEGMTGWIHGTRGWKRALCWAAVLTPFFTPGLVVGYCYRDTMLSLSHRPLANEVLYSLLVAGQTFPIGLVILYFSPPPAVSRAALHCARLASGTTFKSRFAIWDWRAKAQRSDVPKTEARTENPEPGLRRIGLLSSRISLHLRSRWGVRLTAACGMFLVSFQETELASLLQARTWTEWLFTMQAGGLVNPLPYLPAPVGIELLCMLLIVRWIATLGAPRSGQEPEHRAWLAMLLAACWTSVALTIVTIVPAGQMLRGAWQGAGVLARQPSFPREIADALVVSTTATLLALGLLALLQKGRRGSRQRSSRIAGAVQLSFVLLLTLPGLIGALSLGLFLARLFQTEPLVAAYDTPVPLVLGEVLYLLPRGLVLWGCLIPAGDGASHLMSMLMQSQRDRQRRAGLDLHWILRGRRWFWAACILGFWAYLELTLPSLLAAPGMAPAPLLLYNALHYGRISALAAKLLLTLLAPACLAGGMWWVRRPLLRWFSI